MSTENNNPAEQTPVTATPTEPTQVQPVPAQEAPKEAPVSNTEDKTASAFVRMRQERRALKQRVAELENAKPVPQPVQEQPKVETPTPPAPAPEVNIQPTPTPIPANVPEKPADSEAEAIKVLANDPDVGSIPGGIVEILDMIDKDAKLAKLEAIDPKIAYAEAAKLWKESKGISKAPAVAAPVQISGGITGSNADLEAIYAELDKAKPGSKRYSELTAQMNAKLGVTGKPINWGNGQ